MLGLNSSNKCPQIPEGLVIARNETVSVKKNK